MLKATNEDPPSNFSHSSRLMSSVSNPPPEQKAAEIIQSVPASNLVTKTGTVVLGTGLLATAISQELYVMNEEAVVMVGSFILFGVIAKVRANSNKRFGLLLIQELSSSSKNPTRTGLNQTLIRSRMSWPNRVLNIHRPLRTVSTPSSK